MRRGFKSLEIVCPWLRVFLSYEGEVNSVSTLTTISGVFIAGIALTASA